MMGLAYGGGGGRARLLGIDEEGVRACGVTLHFMWRTIVLWM
jgi:hypothetical protein